LPISALCWSDDRRFLFVGTGGRVSVRPVNPSPVDSFREYSVCVDDVSGRIHHITIVQPPHRNDDHRSQRSPSMLLVVASRMVAVFDILQSASSSPSSLPT